MTIWLVSAKNLSITYDSNGLAHKEVTRSAQKGYDLYLTIDIDLQESLDETLSSVLKEHGGTEGRDEFKSLFTCMMDPNSGDVLAMSWIHNGSGYERFDVFCLRKLCFFGKPWFLHQRGYTLYGANGRGCIHR